MICRSQDPWINIEPVVVVRWEKYHGRNVAWMVEKQFQSFLKEMETAMMWSHEMNVKVLFVITTRRPFTVN